MGFENEAQQSLGRSCHRDGRSKRTYRLFIFLAERAHSIQPLMRCGLQTMLSINSRFANLAAFIPCVTYTRARRRALADGRTMVAGADDGERVTGSSPTDRQIPRTDSPLLFLLSPRRAREERAAALWLMAEHAHHQAPEIEAEALSDLGQRLLASRGLSNAKEKIRGSHDVNYRINSTQKHAQAAAWRWFFPSGRKAQTGRKLFTFGFAWDAERNLRRRMVL